MKMNSYMITYFDGQSYQVLEFSMEAANEWANRDAAGRSYSVVEM